MATVVFEKNIGGNVKARRVEVKYTELITAGASQNINLGSVLPSGAALLSARYILKTVFTSGSITGLTCEVGTSSDTDGIITAGQLLSGSPTAGSERAVTGVGVGISAATPLARFTASGANLGDGSASALTAGNIYVDLVYVVLPTY